MPDAASLARTSDFRLRTIDSNRAINVFIIDSAPEILCSKSLSANTDNEVSNHFCFSL